ncbi:MAG: hypothetical protein OXC01_12380 [Immundisolibacterales bacterium]|nr:hypothetical protein [Immundisolibacterales bacterium]
MSASSAGSLADRVAKQLGIAPPHLDGTGPDGSTTLNDVLRQAGRAPPAAARPAPPQTAFHRRRELRSEAVRLEVACDARPLRDACDALAALAEDAPDVPEIVVRLCGTALRDFPRLAAARETQTDSSPPAAIDIMVQGPVGVVPIRGADEAELASVRVAIRAARAPPRTEAAESAHDEVVPEGAFVVCMSDSPGQPGSRAGAVLTMSERSGSILLELEFDPGSRGDGEAFLERLRALCLDPRLALL